MEINDNNIVHYKCELCNYVSNTKKDFMRHGLTQKHKLTFNNTCSNSDKGHLCRSIEKPYDCQTCKKAYKTKSGLWKHSKICSVSRVITPDKTNEIIMDLLKKSTEFAELVMEQNQDFQKQLLGAIKDGKVANHTNNTTNHFNLNVFLNETCKDALNMVDFVKLMRIELTDLEEVGKVGYTDGVSRIFVNGLKGLDVNKRPIHCSDLKRETMYIKEGDVWEKDNDEKTLMKQAIRRVEHKNIIQIPLWVKAHPEAVKGNDTRNEQYLHIVCESTGGSGDPSNNENNINKIIRNIAREVTIIKQ